MNLLLGIKLYDKLLVHRRRLHVFAARQCDDARFVILAIDIEPRRDALALREVARFQHHRVIAHLVLQSDFVAHLNEVARNIYLLAFHSHVAVKHKLPRLCARAGQSHAVHRIVEAPLQHHHQVRARRTLRPLRLLEIVAELAFEQAIGAFYFLLLAQLHAVPDHLRTARLAVLARNKVALFDGTLFCKTPEAFEEEFHPFPSAQPANSFTMSCQVLLSFASATETLRSKDLSYKKSKLDATPLWRTAAIVRHGRHILNRIDVQTGSREGSHCRFTAGA